MGDAEPVAGRRCRAHLCPDDVSDESPEGVFCPLHYDSMPWEFKVWLFDAFDTKNWKPVLTECIRELRRMEAERVQSW